MNAPALSSFVVLWLLYEAALSLFYVRRLCGRARGASGWNWVGLTLAAACGLALVSWSLILHLRNFTTAALSLNIIAIALSILAFAVFYFRLRAIRAPRSLYRYWRVPAWAALATLLAGLLLFFSPTP
jgi:hypothetical protein